MIDLDLRFRLTRRRVAKARRPPTRMRNLVFLVGLVVVLALGSEILGVSPQRLLDAMG